MIVAIIDYKIGNINSVANMLRKINVPCVIANRPEQILAADRIILPGNGSFDACMRGLRATGLVPILEQKVRGEGAPLLGICVGAQMLGISSEEGNEPGLGWLDMRVRRLPAFAGLRVPHMGWNEVSSASDHYLVRDLKSDARFYFLHSYYMEPTDPADVLLRAEYGIGFVAGVARGQILGVQFHPEKSHRFGKQLLSAFVYGEK